MKKRMVVGFVFANSLVYLIKKNRPEWQKGRLNGIGGHVEWKETPEDAMRREFREEAGVDIESWKYVCTMEGDDWLLHVLAAHLPPGEEPTTQTDEEVAPYHEHELHSWETIPNTLFLVPMCRENLNNEHTFKSANFVY